MDKLVVPMADQHTRFAGHSGMDAVSSQKITKYAIVGIGRETADHVAGIDIFDGNINSFVYKVRCDGIFEV